MSWQRKKKYFLQTQYLWEGQQKKEENCKVVFFFCCKQAWGTKPLNSKQVKEEKWVKAKAEPKKKKKIVDEEEGKWMVLRTAVIGQRAKEQENIRRRKEAFNHWTEVKPQTLQRGERKVWGAQ